MKKTFLLLACLTVATLANAQRPRYGDDRITGTYYGEAFSATSAIQGASFVFSASDTILNVGILKPSDNAKAFIYDATRNDISLQTITVPTLDDLGNVDTTGVTVGQVLGYSASGIWSATDVSGSVGSATNSVLITGIVSPVGGIDAGEAVYINGGSGGYPTFSLASNNSASARKPMGMAVQSKAQGQTIQVCIEGLVTGVSTTAFADGGIVYLGDAAGSITATKPKPSEGQSIQVLGWIKSATTNGSIYISPAAIALDKIVDVSAMVVANGDFLRWNSASQIWEATLSQFDSLTNVNFLGKQDGHFPYWDADANVWKTTMVSGSGIAPSFDELSNVDFSDKGSYDVPLVYWNSGLSVWDVTPQINESGGGSGTADIIVSASDSPTLWTNIANYICDGTSDQIEIQRAINALNGSGTVRLAPGSFGISGNIVISTPNVTLLGSGGSSSVTGYSAKMRTSLIRQGSTLTAIAALVLIDDVSSTSTNDPYGVKVQNIFFTGNGKDSTYGCGVYINEDSYESNVLDCMFYNCYFGILSNDNGSVQGRSLIEHCNFYKNKYGIFVENNSGTFLTINKCGFYNTYTCSVCMNTLQGSYIITNNAFLNDVAKAMLFYTATQPTNIQYIIKNNLIINPGSYAMEIDFGNSTTTTASSINIVNNAIKSAGSTAIYLQDCGEVGINCEGNTILGTDAGNGITAIDSSYTKIVNNTILDVYNVGIDISTSSNFTKISGNYIYNSGATGIFVYTYGDYTCIDNNYIKGAGTNGIYTTTYTNPYRIYNIDIRNNNIIDYNEDAITSAYGVYLDNSENCNVSNNYIYEGDASGNSIGIFLSSGTDQNDHTISNNSIKGTGIDYPLWDEAVGSGKITSPVGSVLYNQLFQNSSGSAHTYYIVGASVGIKTRWGTDSDVPGYDNHIGKKTYIDDVGTNNIQASKGNIKNASFASANTVGDATVGGTLKIGADVSMSRTAADVLSTGDSIVSATHAINGDMILGNSKNQKQVFKNENNYYIANAAVYSNTTATGYYGILRLETPINVTGFAHYMPDIVIRGYSYDYKSDFRYSIHFYWYNGTSFINTSCNTEGACPTNVITVGLKNNCITISLGTASTYWGIFAAYADISSKSYATAAKDTDFESTYKLRFTINNSDLASTATISALNVHGVDYQGRVIGKLTPITTGYVLDVSGAAYVSGTIYGAGTISGGTLVDRTDASKEDAITEVNRWKVIGNEVDHDSLGDCAIEHSIVKTGFIVEDKSGNLYNSLEDKTIQGKDSKESELTKLSETVESIKLGIQKISSEYTIKETTQTVIEKGRNISKTISTLSRAIQQLSERLDALESLSTKEIAK